jgi:hypothetical protein
MKKILVVGVILLFLGSSIPALAKTQSSEHYKVYIGAGVYREHEGKIGYGWHMTVENDGDTTITFVMSYNETTLSGKVLFNGSYPPFSLPPGGWATAGGADFYPIVRIYLTVEVGNMTYTKSGFEVGSFIFLVG